jgi:hypothetical protein
MQTSHSPSMGLMWFGILALIGIAVAIDVYFWFGEDVDEKRRLYPWAWGLLGSLLIAFFVFVLPLPLPVLGVLAFVVVLATFAHIQQVRFCPKCARRIRRAPFTRVDYCPRCGHRLDDAADG